MAATTATQRETDDDDDEEFWPASMAEPQLRLGFDISKAQQMNVCRALANTL